MAPQLLSAVEAAISQATGGAFRCTSCVAATGGCIHRSFIIQGASERYFVKTNDRKVLDAFEAEADGLAALAQAGIRVPHAICRGETGAQAFLVLEYLELRSGGEGALLGRALALLHASRGAAHGWHRDNYIGATVQRNRPHPSWAAFFREQRIRPQLELAAKNGHRRLERPGEKLCARIEALLSAHQPQPSLLHGDLWSGNAAWLADGTPVLFDPAVYYGDAEADLAMTELFAGFPASFYAAYREVRPVESGYAVRKDLYNLYHVLNHVNLFGGSYTAQARSLMERLLAL